MGDRLQADKPSRYVTSHPGQLSLAIPLWVGATSTSESWDIKRHTEQCTSPVSVVWQCKLVSGLGLMKRRSAPPYGPYGSGRTLRYVFTYSVISCNLFTLIDAINKAAEAWGVDCKRYEISKSTALCWALSNLAFISDNIVIFLELALAALERLWRITMGRILAFVCWFIAWNLLIFFQPRLVPGGSKKTLL